jgi:hypothetical protein
MNHRFIPLEKIPGEPSTDPLRRAYESGACTCRCKTDGGSCACYRLTGLNVDAHGFPRAAHEPCTPEVRTDAVDVVDDFKAFVARIDATDDDDPVADAQAAHERRMANAWREDSKSGWTEPGWRPEGRAGESKLDQYRRAWDVPDMTDDELGELQKSYPKLDDVSRHNAQRSIATLRGRRSALLEKERGQPKRAPVGPTRTSEVTEDETENFDALRARWVALGNPAPRQGHREPTDLERLQERAKRLDVFDGETFDTSDDPVTRAREAHEARMASAGRRSA